MLIICLIFSFVVVPVVEPIVTCTGQRMYLRASCSILGAIVAENLSIRGVESDE